MWHLHFEFSVLIYFPGDPVNRKLCTCVGTLVVLTDREFRSHETARSPRLPRSRRLGMAFDPEREGAAEERPEHEEAINITLFQRRVKCPRSGRRARSEIVAELCIAGACCERNALVYAASSHLLVSLKLLARCEFSRGETTCYFWAINYERCIINAVSYF